MTEWPDPDVRKEHLERDALHLLSLPFRPVGKERDEIRAMLLRNWDDDLDSILDQVIEEAALFVREAVAGQRVIERLQPSLKQAWNHEWDALKDDPDPLRRYVEKIGIDRDLEGLEEPPT